ncbi:MAG TPA: GNAT family N-acetyltransferase [Chthonomonadaceae bacterium]|nr:GNAT family N-acetyltransferase [Chthonomonadaceae bacterium]
MVTTPRLLLRAFTLEDMDAVYEYWSDPEVMRYQPGEPRTMLDQAQRRLQNLAAGGEEPPRRGSCFAIVLKSEGQVIGECLLYAHNPDLREAGIGYTLNRRYWGLGLATEAAGRVVRYGFEEMGLHRIFAECRPENRASARVLEKIGMRLEGHLRENKWIKGRWEDTLLFAILEQEWQERKQGTGNREQGAEKSREEGRGDAD